MSRSRSKKSKGAQLPLFIQKLIEMLDDSQIDNIISWTSSNDSFNIKSISQFTQTILPKYFKHNNFSSFIRQLNMYGFRKIRHEDGQNVYENQNFKRGNRNLLKNIKRKINQQKDDKLALYSQQGHSNHNLSRQIQDMKNKQKDLQQICRHLLMQNQKLIDQNNSLMRKMKDQSKKKERKIQHLLLTFMTANQNKQPSITNGDTNQANNMGNVLSIMSGQNSSDYNTLNQKSEDTPLQVLTNAFSRNKNMRQFKQMLQNFYNDDTKPITQNNMINTRMTRRRNQTLLSNQNPRINQNHVQFEVSPGRNNPSLLHDQDSSGFNFGQGSNQHFFDQSHEPDIVKPSHMQDDGFISINQFINLDDQNVPAIQDCQNIHLDESN